MRVKIITDSSAYLDNCTCQELGITVIPLMVNIEGQSYPETTLDVKQLYAALDKLRVRPTTSQPSLGDIYREFSLQAETGRPVLGIFISSLLSGTYSAALRARSMVLEKYPQVRIEIVDSRAACMGFMVLAAARAAQEGRDLEEVLQVALDRAEKSHFLFVPASLEYLAKGGRIGEASALMGTLLNIKPVLALKNGQIIVREKVRTADKAQARMIEIMRKDLAYRGFAEAGVGHVDCLDQAAVMAERIEQELGITVTLRGIGPVLGLHLGPGTLGLSYTTKK